MIKTLGNKTMLFFTSDRTSWNLEGGDMYVWVAPRPPFGYTETNARRIKEQILQKNEMTAFLIRIDRETGKQRAKKDWALDASCQIEAQRNWSINNLRFDLRSLLEEMGNTIIPVGDGMAVGMWGCQGVGENHNVDRLVWILIQI